MAIWATDAPASLKSFICDKSVSASSSGFNIKSNKHLITGHGINTKLFFPNKKISYKKKLNEIVYVGRISKIKNIHILLHAINNLGLTYYKKKSYEKLYVISNKLLNLTKTTWILF